MARRTRLGRPPRTDNPDLDRYLARIQEEMNLLPNFSIISTSDGPNSNHTGNEGDLVIDVGSSVTKVWVKQNDTTSTTTWTALDN